MELKMKAIRMFTVVMALALFAVALFPFAAKPVAAKTSQTIMVTSPAQALMDAARGMPLLAPISVTVPLITLSLESATEVPGYACRLTSQKPKNYTWMVPRKIFDMQWTVKNTGAHMWITNAVTLKYISGTKMQTYGNEFALNRQVLKNNSTTLVVDMTAPKASGIYSTTWGLYASKNPFCTVTLTINVSR
jgi:hypothetical protein